MKRPVATSVTTLFLDVGGVLLTNGWDHHMRQQAADQFHLDYDEMSARHGLSFDVYEQGKLTLDEYLDWLVFYQPRPFSRKAFHRFLLAQSQPFPEMIRLVGNLKSRYGLKIAVVSNEGRELTEYRIRKFNLGAFVDFFVSSCFVHFRKPDADIYRLALDVAQVKPEQVLYIDDRAMFVQVARGMGIRGIHHTGYETTRQALEKAGLSLTEGYSPKPKSPSPPPAVGKGIVNRRKGAHR